MSDMTQEENNLFKCIKRPPECIHPPEDIIEGKECWTCIKCRRSVTKNFYSNSCNFTVTSYKVEFNDS